MEYLTVGTIVKTVGLKGEVKVYPSTSFRDSRFKKGSHLFIIDKDNNVLRELTVKVHRINGSLDQLTFEEVPDTLSVRIESTSIVAFVLLIFTLAALV